MMVGYVIKKGKRYVLSDLVEDSFTTSLVNAKIFRTKTEAKDAVFPGEGEIVIKVKVTRTVEEI